MKNTTKKYMRTLLIAFAALLSPLSMMAQSSLGAPGSGGGPAGGSSSLPAPGAGGSFQPNAPAGGPNGIGWNPGPGFGGPMNSWYTGWNAPSAVVNPVVVNPNQGVEKVMACGYDAQGNWDVLPLVVAYQYNGVQYNVTVLNAWNPFTDMWDRGVDMPAYNTSFYTHGITYNFYTPLSTGTYYFNL